MKSVLLLILSNIRRKKTSFLLMGISFFISAFLLTGAAGLLTRLPRAFDGMMDRTRGGNLILEFSLDQYPDRDIKGWWSGRPEVAGCREYPVFIAPRKFFHRGEPIDTTVYVSEVREESGGTDRLIDASSGEVFSGAPAAGEIWISSILRYSHDIRLGDTVGIPTPRGVVDFTVSAFVNDPQFNSSWGFKRFWISPGDLCLLASPLVYTDRLVSVRLTDPGDQTRLLGEFKDFLGGSFEGSVYGYDKIKNDYLLIYNIIGIVLAAVSLITILVAIIILSGNLNAFICSEYRQMGIARAIGFTSRSLVLVYILETIITSLSFSLVAVLAGKTSVAILLQFMAERSGMISTGDEMGEIAGLVFLAVNLFALFFSWGSARRIRKVDPSRAIRFGFSSLKKRPGKPSARLHSFSARVPLFMAARNLRTGSGGLFYSLLSFLLMVTICSISFNADSLLQDSLSDRKFWGIADAHLSFYKQGGLLESPSDSQLENLLLDHPNVETLLSSSSQINGYIRSDREEPFAVIGYVYSREMEALGLINQRGNHPLVPGEISISDRLAEKYKLGPGDDIALFANGTESVYTISGIFQNSDNLGFSFRMLDQTYRQSHPSYSPSHFHVRLAHPDKAQETLEEIEGAYGMYFDGVLTSLTILEIERDFGSTMPYVKLLFGFISAIFFLISFIVIHNNTLDFILEYRKSLGILKALGITPRQLRSIGVIRILILLGVCLLIGFPLSVFLSPQLLNLAFHNLGFGAFTPRPGLGDLLWIVPIVTAFGFISSWIPMGQTTEIQTRDLLRGE